MDPRISRQSPLSRIVLLHLRNKNHIPHETPVSPSSLPVLRKYRIFILFPQFFSARPFGTRPILRSQFFAGPFSAVKKKIRARMKRNTTIAIPSNAGYCYFDSTTVVSSSLLVLRVSFASQPPQSLRAAALYFLNNNQSRIWSRTVPSPPPRSRPPPSAFSTVFSKRGGRIELHDSSGATPAPLLVLLLVPPAARWCSLAFPGAARGSEPEGALVGGARESSGIIIANEYSEFHARFGHWRAAQVPVVTPVSPARLRCCIRNMASSTLLVCSLMEKYCPKINRRFYTEKKIT